MVSPLQLGDVPAACPEARQIVVEKRGRWARASALQTRGPTSRKQRIGTRLGLVDDLLDGGLVRGRVGEAIGPSGCGKTSLAAAFAAGATANGELTAWIDLTGSFDPASAAAAGVDLSRLLWVIATGSRPAVTAIRTSPANGDDSALRALRAAELALETSAFGLVVVDLGDRPRSVARSGALRLARWAERGGAAVLLLARHSLCGSFAAWTLALAPVRRCFSRSAAAAPVLFEGIKVKACMVRNKLGASGRMAIWQATLDPAWNAWSPAPGAEPASSGVAAPDRLSWAAAIAAAGRAAVG